MRHTPTQTRVLSPGAAASEEHGLVHPVWPARHCRVSTRRRPASCLPDLLGLGNLRARLNAGPGTRLHVACFPGGGRPAAGARCAVVTLAAVAPGSEPRIRLPSLARSLLSAWEEASGLSDTSVPVPTMEGQRLWLDVAMSSMGNPNCHNPLSVLPDPDLGSEGDRTS